LFNNILNSFYKYTFIVSRTINTNIYLRFRVFNIVFNYFCYLKKTIINYSCFLREIILKVCKKNLIKFVKYYLKTEKLNKILYNLINILNSIQKLSFYKI